MSCYSKFIGFKACGANESKSGLYIDDLGFTLWQGSHLANESDVTGVNLYWRVHDAAMIMLEEYFFERLRKFQTYNSYLDSYMVGKSTDQTTVIENVDYKVEDEPYVNHTIRTVWIKPIDDGPVIVNGESHDLIGGVLNEIDIDSDRLEIPGPVAVYGCGENGFKIEVVRECDPHKFFCKFLKYLKKPALYLVYASLAEEALTTGRNSAMVVNMSDKYRLITFNMMGGTDPVTEKFVKGKFWVSLDNTIERIGRQMMETECIECSGARLVDSLP